MPCGAAVVQWCSGLLKFTISVMHRYSSLPPCHFVEPRVNWWVLLPLLYSYYSILP